MPSYIALVTLKDNTALPENYVTNSLAFDDAGATTDPNNLALDLCQIYVDFWGTSRPDVMTHVEVRIYDHGDAQPRPIKGQAELELLGGTGGVLPREVALCLSFYADRNLPRNRGRIYVGPWRLAEGNDRPSPTLQSEVLGLASSFAALGGLDVDWAVWSRTDNVFRHITHAWVDDSWDTVRSRGLAPTSRVTADDIQ